MKSRTTKNALQNLQTTFNAIDAVAENNDKKGENLQLLIWLMSQELTSKKYMDGWITAKRYLLGEVSTFFDNCPSQTQAKLVKSLQKAVDHPESVSANAAISSQPYGGLSPNLTPTKTDGGLEPNLAKRALKTLGIT